MLHPAQSINPYHRAPTLKMECADAPLLDGSAGEGEIESEGKVVLWWRIGYRKKEGDGSRRWRENEIWPRQK